VANFYRELTLELRNLGYVQIGNAKGSHEKWRNPDTGQTLIVPPGTKSRHTANAILKDAGSAKRF
jgi:predicted RNA binding protein YcfA (HicA-like mRNA interferase family)